MNIVYHFHSLLKVSSKFMSSMGSSRYHRAVVLRESFGIIAIVKRFSGFKSLLRGSRCPWPRVASEPLPCRPSVPIVLARFGNRVRDGGGVTVRRRSSVCDALESIAKSECGILDSIAKTARNMSCKVIFSAT